MALACLIFKLNAWTRGKKKGKKKRKEEEEEEMVMNGRYKVVLSSLYKLIHSVYIYSYTPLTVNVMSE